MIQPFIINLLLPFVPTIIHTTTLFDFSPLHALHNEHLHTWTCSFSCTPISTLPYVTKKPSWDFLRSSCQCAFLQRWSPEAVKKISWHFFDGHLGLLAAQNLKLLPSEIDLGGGVTLIRKSMTDAYVTLPPKSISFCGHFGFWAANGSRWQTKKCQDDFYTSCPINYKKKHGGKNYAKKTIRVYTICDFACL